MSPAVSTPFAPPVTPAQVQEIVRQLKAALSPRRIWVFGSYARGDWREGSDLDLLVEMDTDLPPHLRRLAARRAVGPKPCPMDILVYTPAEIEERRNSLGSIIPTILAEGVLVG